MKNGEFRARAQRFLAGQFKSDDLDKLYLFLRSRSFGASTVTDIGNLIGHADRRETGVDIGRVWDRYQVWRYIMPRIESPGGVMDFECLPANTLDILSVNLRVISDKQLLDSAGCTKKQAASIIGRLPKKFSSNMDRTLRFSGNHISDREIELVRTLTGILNAAAIYSSDEIINDFAHALVKNGLIELEQVASVNEKRELLLLYVIVSMHGTILRMPDGTEVPVTAGFHDNATSSLLHVQYTLTLPFKGDTRRISTDLLSTDMQAKDWLDQYDATLHSGLFTVPIEINADQRIAPIDAEGPHIL